MNAIKKTIITQELGMKSASPESMSVIIGARVVAEAYRRGRNTVCSSTVIVPDADKDTHERLRNWGYLPHGFLADNYAPQGIDSTVFVLSENDDAQRDS